MSQETTVIKSIVKLLFGTKYYANIVNTRGTIRTELCSFIFRTKEEAQRHREEVEGTITYRFIETISFWSRKDYYQRPNDAVDHCIR